MSNRSLVNLLQTMTPAVRQSPLRALFLAVAVALCGLMTVADLPSAAPVHAQEQQVTPTKESTGTAPPERPADLEASASHDSVTLTWTASTDDTVTHYAVLRRDRNADASGVFHVIDSNAGPGISYTDDTVSPKGSYVYRVKAVNTTGVSQWSSYARADTPPDPEALAPSGLSAKVVSGDDGVIEGVALAWDAPAEDAASVTGYEILRAVGDGDLATLVADTGSTDTSHTDDTATEAGESYAYRVKALRGEEASQPSNRAEAFIPSVTVVPGDPPTPLPQNVVDICSRTAEVQAEIIDKIGGTCSTITDTQLATIEYLYIDGYSSANIVTTDFAGLTGLIEVGINNSRQLTTLQANAFSGLTSFSSLKSVSVRANAVETIDPDAFAGLSAITTLDLSYNAIEHFHPDTFDGLSSLNILDLGFNHIKVLEEGVFGGLSALTKLHLSNNRIAVVDRSTFAGPSALSLLSLSSNAISMLPEDAFSDLPTLKQLWLTDNSLSTLPADIFDGLTSLNQLHIIGNGISTLDEDIFDGLTNLRSLFINSNSFETLDDDIFDGLTGLQTLDLGNNSLSSLNEHIFDGLTSLSNLGLAGNSLDTLHEDVFDGLTSLSRLGLNGNSLDALDKDIFDGLTSLRTLFLYNNSLDALDKDIFDGLTSLQYLLLNNNSLDVLDKDIFDDPDSLQYLLLNNNSLDTLDKDIFDGLTSLQFLYLGNNDLDTLDEEILDGLVDLERLYINNNSISSLPTDLFDPLDDSLQRLYLTDNSIASVPADVFDGLTGLLHLDLSCNSLTTLELTRFDPFASSLTYLDITGNSFTTAPTDAAVRAKLTAIENLYISGTNTECSLPNDTGLSAFSVSTGVHQPFEPTRTLYYVLLGHDVSSLTVTFATRDSNATVELPSRDPNSPDDVYDNDPDTDGIQVNLSQVRNQIKWDVRARDGVTITRYLVQIFRAHPPATNARLRDLTLSGVTMEDFDSRTYTYTATAPPTSSETMVTALPLDPDATTVTTLNGVEDDDGTVDLEVGSNTITVEVTAEDATTTQTYTVTVTRDAPTNTAPEFPADRDVRLVLENSPPGTSVGDPVTATDDDGDTLTYTLEGDDALSFAIDSSSGQIQTIAGVTYDHEAKSSYLVTVKADDGKEGTDTIIIAIGLTDVDEPPSTPNAPNVSPVADSTTSLLVSWTAPDNTGKPDIQSYDLQYRQGTSSWTDGPQDETGTSATITGLAAGTEYQVRVRATNDEDNSDWSTEGTGSTNAADCPALPAGRLWSACLTAGMVDQGVFGYQGATSDGSLAPATFDVGATTYTVTGLTDSDNVSNFTGVKITLQPALAATDAGALTLHIGDATSLAFADATPAVSSASSQYRWSLPAALGWSAGDAIVVGITQEDTSAAPTVSSVVVTSDPGADETYAIGDAIDVTVTFSDTVTVDATGGTPQLELDVGGTPRQAAYASGTGTAALVFTYNVVLGDEDTDGIAIGVDKLDLNGGTIQSADGTDAELAYTEPGTQSGHKVDGVRPTLVSAETSVDGNTVSVTFSESLSSADANRFTVSQANDPSVTSATIDANDDKVVTLTLSRALSHDDTLALEIAPNAVQDAAGNYNDRLSGSVTNNVPPPNAAPVFTSDADFSADEDQTAVGTVMATDADAGDTVTYAVTGGADQARFQIGPDSGVLTFATAPDHEDPGDADTNNVYQVTVTATGGTGARAMTATQDISVTVNDVDETPAITSVSVVSDPGADDTYGLGDTIEVQVTFDQAVTVNTSGGAPSIEFEAGGNQAEHLKLATYADGSGTATLRFDYVVQSGDMDDNGIWLKGDKLKLNGGTILGVDDDVAANLDYTSLGRQDDHKVDGSLTTTPAGCGTLPAGRLWSACLTVGTFTVSGVTFLGWDDIPNYTGASLSDEEFDYGADTYNLKSISFEGGGLTVAFNDTGVGDIATEATRDKLTLHVGDTDTFNFGDGDLNIPQTGVFWSSTGLTWADGETVALSISVPAPTTPVPTTWSLVPSGLVDGDSFRLLFIGTNGRDASSSDIAVYNTFIQNLAAAGHADIQAHSATFRVVGSTEDVDARDNTGTTGTGVPIYWLNGAKVADDYADFYDGDWDEEREIARETGALVSISANWKIWTGSAEDGTEWMHTDGTSRALGNSGGQWVMQGSPNSSNNAYGPIESDTANRTTDRGLYGLSGVFTVDASLDPVNTPPTFQQENTTREVEENSPAGTAVGDPVTATDADDDTLTYTLEGTDAASFQIVSTSGQIQTKSGITYDYETKEEYAVTVRADDGKGGTDTIAVAIDLLDVDETAPTPGVSSVDVTSTPSATADTYGWNETIEVTVTFDQAVRVTGTPRIQLRIGGGQPQHRKWANYAGGTGTTALRFTYVVQAGDMDDDGIYIEANELELNGGTILSVDDDVAAVLDYARPGTQSGHKVNGSLTTIVPGTPTGLSATAAGQTVVDLSWTAPDGPVTGYRIEYRPEGGSWTDVEADTGSPATTYRHQELDPGTTYEYRVSAINPAGTGTASNTASATTDEQGSPVFTSGAAFSVEENETAVGTVTAADPDPEDTVRYAITGGDDREHFQIDPASGALTFMTSPDYESPADADENNVYQVTVTATGGEGARALTADQAITVTVTGVNEPPGKPVGPWASWLVDNPGTLSVRWYAPHWGDESESFGKPPITSYQVRYQKGDIDDWGKWEKWEEWTYWPDAQGIPTVEAAANSAQTEFSVYIDGLEPGATYQLQVRAVNDDGAGVWSNRGSNRKPTGPVAEVDVNGDGIVDADPVITLPVGGAATYRVRPGRCEGYKSLNAQALRGTTENAPQHIPVDVSPADVYMTCAGEDDPGEWQEITLTGPSDELLSTPFEASVRHTVMYQQRSHESWIFLMSWGHLVTAEVPAPETLDPVGSLTVTAEEGRDRPHVTWNAVPGAPYYQVQWRWGPDEEWGPFQSQGGATYTRQKETEETAYTIPISGTVPTVNDVKRTQDVTVRVRPFDYDRLAVGPWREVTLPGRAVRPPEIIGTARVGQTLTADTSPITRQSAALADAAFSYQWLRTGGAYGYYDIPGATGSTYTLTPYDEVRRIKVRVTFTNEEGEEETQTSSVTAKVAPADADESEVALPASAAVLAGFSLVDAGASPQTLLAQPMDGASVELVNPDGGSYAIRADLNEGHTAGSVALELTGRKSASTTEGVMPYSLYGDDGAGALRGEALPAGSYVLTMTAYEGSGGGGAVLHTLEVSFTVTAAAEEPGTGQEDEEEENTAPLTALFLYEEPLGYHSGAGTTLTVRLSFSEAVSITPEALGQALALTNATVWAVSRVDGRSDLWEVRLTPHSDATVTVLLPLAADCDAAGAVCTGDGRAPAHAIGTAIPGPPPNSQATGAPTIDGVAEVGQVLSAHVTGIDDDNAAFSYQWLRSDGGDYTEIAGANGDTYTLVAADQGKTIKVKVSFTDDEGNPETLTSDPTGEVEAAETVPGRPQDLEGEASAQGIALTWNAPVDSTVTSYVIYRAVLDDGQLHGKPMTRYATIDATGADMAYTDDEAEAGVEYRYRVAAVNSAGEGKKSTWINIFAEDS